MFSLSNIVTDDGYKEMLWSGVRDVNNNAPTIRIPPATANHHYDYALRIVCPVVLMMADAERMPVREWARAPCHLKIFYYLGLGCTLHGNGNTILNIIKQ